MRPQLITDPKSLEYLIGFTGSHGFMVRGKKNLFFTDFRYRGIAKELQRNKTRLPFKFVEIDEKILQHIQKNLRGKQVEFEAGHLTVAALNSWKKKLKGLKWVPGKNSIEMMRLFKDKNEIALLKKSQKINEETLYRTKKLFKKGVTELELAWKIKTIGHDLGAEDISFEPIVAFGSHSAIPHHHNSNTKLKTGDTLLVDMGMKYKGYCSDMTRTFFFGKPNAEQEKIYQLVLEAQEAGIKKVKAGMSVSKVDEASRKVMGKYEKYFKHSLGHGIGLEVHEIPSLSGRSKEILKENMIVTVEPGIYLDGKFGVRIEDMGRVTAKGYENFTGAAKEFSEAVVRA